VTVPSFPSQVFRSRCSSSRFNRKQLQLEGYRREIGDDALNAHHCGGNIFPKEYVLSENLNEMNFFDLRATYMA
jgi:hypothetical protein